MSQLDHMLDDALAGFDDDNEGFTFAGSRGLPSDAAPASPVSAASSGSSLASSAHAGAVRVQAQATCSRRQNSNFEAVSDPAAASTSWISGNSASSSSSISSSKPFDPLRRKPKGKAVGTSAAAGLAGGSLGISSSTGGKRAALTPEVHKLQEDLAKLMSEWSTAMHPEADEPSQQASGQHRGASAAVLAALAEQTQRTVKQQSKLRPPPAGAAAASSSSGGGGGEQMNMIVDVVMQHLLSKEVLYQPMKEIMDKYPPWLDKQAGSSGSSSSSLSPAERERYQQQYACIRRLCQAYETEPDNTAKIMDLLQEMQACGEPPAEIVEEMSAAIAADLPAEATAGGGGAAAAAAAGGLGLNNAELEGLGQLPPELRNCPVQ